MNVHNTSSALAKLEDKLPKRRTRNAHVRNTGSQVTHDSTWSRLNTYRTTARLTPELTEAICKDIEASLPIVEACIANGVARSTFYDWKRRGETGGEPYKKFFEAVEIAQARAIRRLTEKALSKDESRGATFLLERRFRNEYGAKQEIDMNQHGLVTKIEQVRLEPQFVPIDERGRALPEYLERMRREKLNP